MIVGAVDDDARESVHAVKMRTVREKVVAAGAALAAALVVGALGGWWMRSATADDHWAVPRVVEGWAFQAGTSGGIGCCSRSAEGADGHGYDVNRVMWRDIRDRTDTWHGDDKDSPDCLPANKPVLVRFGVIDIAPTEDAPGRQAVAWLECR